MMPNRRWPRRLLVVTNVVCLLLLTGAGATYGYVRWRFGQIKKVSVPGLTAVGKGTQSHKTSTSTSTEPPMTILITGSDTRAVGNGKFGSTAQVGGQRSDAIILARVVPATKQVALLSIPRDLLVDIPGMGTTRINAAFNDGAKLLIQTIKNNFGIEINHYVGVNFATFEQIANAIGGVEQYFPTPAKDVESGLDVTRAGCVNLTGSQALAFVRSRNYQYYLDGQWSYQVYPESDLGRIERQQAFIKAAVKKAEASGLTNPIRLDHIVAAIVKNLTIDNTFTTNQLITLAENLRHVSPGAMKNWTLPTRNSTAVPGALDSIPNLDKAMIQKFLDIGQTTSPTTTTTATTPKVNPASVTVTVLNGSGVSKQAATAAQALQSKGYRIGLIGDASQTTTETLIDYSPGHRAAAEAIQALVGGSSTVQEDSGLTSSDVSVTTGTDFTSIASSSSSSTSSGATTTTTVPSDAGQSESPLTDTNTATVIPGDASYIGGQYVPPGLVPGQKVPSCGG